MLCVPVRVCVSIYVYVFIRLPYFVSCMLNVITHVKSNLSVSSRF